MLVQKSTTVMVTVISDLTSQQHQIENSVQKEVTVIATAMRNVIPSLNKARRPVKMTAAMEKNAEKQKRKIPDLNAEVNKVKLTKKAITNSPKVENNLMLAHQKNITKAATAISDPTSHLHPAESSALNETIATVTKSVTITRIKARRVVKVKIATERNTANNFTTGRNKKKFTLNIKRIVNLSAKRAIRMSIEMSK